MSKIKVEKYHVPSLQLATNLLAVLGRKTVEPAEFLMLYAHIAKAENVKQIKNYLLKNYTNVMASAIEIDKVLSMYDY